MMEERHYAFFQNRDCEYFPCHATKHPEDFNCLFCYCPLYALGRGCGGNFRYTENGIKDCSGCLFPHRRENYDRVTARFMEIVKKCRKASEVLPGSDSTASGCAPRTFLAKNRHSTARRVPDFVL